MAYIRRGVKKNLCCCCETIYHIYTIYIYMKISIPWDVYTGCVYGLCIRAVYTGCVYGLCKKSLLLLRNHIPHTIYI